MMKLTFNFAWKMKLQTMHGEFDIEVYGSIIKVVLRGAFNDIGAKALAVELKNNVKAYQQAPFTIMMNLLAFDGGTPEVFAESESFNAWLNNTNMVAKALIFTSPALIAIERTLVKSKAPQNIRYFDNEDDAQIWLDEYIDEFHSKLA